ncbi:Jag family protein [Aquipuribacter sp. SD81]|uniref:Jag family protein n=1 Tax=Aquipuribacter sp. SD81 TaxID=3127703 RepID=UPI003FA61068
MDSTADETTGTATAEGAEPGAASATTAGAGASGSAEEERSPSRRQQLLDQEGDAAADYLEELLDIVDLDGDIDIDVENGRASVAVVADGSDAKDLLRLVGRDGEVLEALQELARLAAQAKTGERSRLLLDIAGWREQRRSTASRIAAEAVERARATGESVELEPMPAYQRKAVHDAVAEAGLRSESDGVEPNRFVVVLPD